jgi:hypothetical protein
MIATCLRLISASVNLNSDVLTDRTPKSRPCPVDSQLRIRPRVPCSRSSRYKACSFEEPRGLSCWIVTRNALGMPRVHWPMVRPLDRAPTGIHWQKLALRGRQLRSIWYRTRPATVLAGQAVHHPGSHLRIYSWIGHLLAPPSPPMASSDTISRSSTFPPPEQSKAAG